ncbi:MAG TPA: hypothetical protein VLX92_07155, partial [Kofleriaceae bacterium]|nr:hypothetical protein [Kofleriaceae bacterium]
MTGVLDELAGRSPRALLEELVRLAVGLARLDRPRPEVELFLASGQIVRGRVVSLDDTRDGAMLLLHVAGRDQAPTVAFVRMDHVAAVTVIDASVLVRPPVSDEPAPSRVELMRRVAAQHDALATRL